MAVKTMQVSSQTGKFDAGWHELTINKAENGVWTSQTGVDKKYHRCRIYNSIHKANRCLERLNNCKWVEWIDYNVEVINNG